MLKQRTTYKDESIHANGTIDVKIPSLLNPQISALCIDSNANITSTDFYSERKRKVMEEGFDNDTNLLDSSTSNPPNRRGDEMQITGKQDAPIMAGAHIILSLKRTWTTKTFKCDENRKITGTERGVRQQKSPLQ